MATGQAERQQKSVERQRQALYHLLAARRVAQSFEGGKTLGEAFETERSHLEAHRAARSRRLAVARSIDALSDVHGPILGWRAQLDSKVTPDCKDAHGKNFRAARMPPQGYPGGVHMNCLPGETLVTGGIVDAVTARWYSGSLVQIRTARGYDLSVTPNHPVLTPDGWLAACLLVNAGYVVSCREPERVALALSPDNHYGPAFIEDIFKSLSILDGMLSSMPGTPIDFHGDGLDSEVHIVWTNSFLRNRLKSLYLEQAKQSALVVGDIGGSEFSRLSLPAEGFEGSLTASHGIMSGDSVPSIYGGGALAHHELVGALAASDANTVVAQDGTDGGPTDAVALRESLLGFPGEVAIDQIIDIRRVPFLGHVYNLQVQNGWYVAQNIITHNCRCNAVAAYPNAQMLS